ncbi:MAG: hypothetical protein ACD_65C00050G0004 [uncultured bacterium]|nr:MAG: hypothetical protein ACD_65C00050G0004 [uncultured bacterium]KKT01717.1 MAG: hypothetical protein UV80_C0009G0007 [Candidatus Peregrinibacteria bacterium GW2011_GWF2_43_17]KKT20632.1 MAG: hypothetical protein UW03_C0001G0002 [Candidatus Peregrinibacteria bacterium GW2011_GWA2_43_8]HAU39321.1 hypothetical protein [Candidatus Peregrinibacteria bacterium]
MNELNPKTQRILDERLIPAMRDLMLNRDELADAWGSTDPGSAIREIMKKYLERYFPKMEDVQKRILDKVEKIKDEPRKMNSLAKFLSGEISLGDDFDPNEFLKDTVSEIAQMHNQNEFMNAAFGANMALQDSRRQDAFQRQKSLLPRIFGGKKDESYKFEFETTAGGMDMPQRLRSPKKRTRKDVIQEEITTRQPIQPQKTEIKETVKKEPAETVAEMRQAQAEKQNMEAYNDELAQDMAQKAQEIADMEARQQSVATQGKKSFLAKATSGKGIATAVVGGGMGITAIIGSMLSGGTT